MYVISNIGSFGEGVYKIGMTRRLDPMDRVRELGDASVPFTFGVHAIIFTNDAPGLEATLHQEFGPRRVNRINNCKEFFRVSLSEIQSAVGQHQGEIEFTQLAEASDYRETVALWRNGAEASQDASALATASERLKQIMNRVDGDPDEHAALGRESAAGAVRI